MIKITDFMDESLINLALYSKEKNGIILELSEILTKSPNILDKTKCYEAIVEREKIGSTGIGKGVAIPHAKTEIAKKLTIGFGISKPGVDFDSLDSEKTQIFFVFASPQKESQVYLKILARISRLIRSETFRKALLAAKENAEILSLIDKEENLV